MAGKKQVGQDKKFLSLPRLRAEHGLQTPVTYEWTESPQALSHISRSIDVQNSAEKGYSIPDIFSQSIQFEFDLSIGNADAVGKWQGLLATLLLAGTFGHVQVRELVVDALPDAPFTCVFKSVAKRRRISRITLFELRRKDGEYSAVAFRYDGMPTMLCPAADIRGPFIVDDPWIVQSEHGMVFTEPTALLEDERYESRRVALRNEIYALSARAIPGKENRDGLQLTRLKAYFNWLNREGDGISSHPVNAQVRASLYTLDDAEAKLSSDVFTDRLCLFREGDGHNQLHAIADETMSVFSDSGPTEWRALLPLRREYARNNLALLRGGVLRMRLQWHNGAVDAELKDEDGIVRESKRYRIQDLINYTRSRNAPQIAVWPPKALAGWNRYYLLRVDDGSVLPLSAHVVGVGDAAADVTLLTAMPTCLSFQMEREEVGVMFPAFETAANPKAKEYNIGFDFGTTGTTAYKHDVAAGVTAPVSFAEEGALFLFGKRDGADIALTAQFISERIADRATHYSLLRQKTDLVQEGGCLLHTTIPFLTGSAFHSEVITDVSDNLKWGVLAADKLRAYLFLEQYLMMCLWHLTQCGASAVHWRASYPLSMFGRLQEDYVSKIHTIIGGLCEHCYKIPFETQFCSESEAVGFMMMDNNIQARYLKGRTVNDNTGFFCIDIGGGSTDLSLWLRRKPLVQTSLRWAGNAILSDSVSREHHGEGCPPRKNLIDFFFAPDMDQDKRAALSAPLESGQYDAFRRVWNVLVDDIADTIKGLHRTNEPLLNYLNIVRINLYLIFYFGGRMVREAILDGSKVGTLGTPLPVAILGNGAKMIKLLYEDVEMLQQPRPDGTVGRTARERQNISRYTEEMDRLLKAFKAGCNIEGFEAILIEPFMPKQETAWGLALAPEAFLSQRAREPEQRLAQSGWPAKCAYDRAENGVVIQAMTDEYRTLVMDSFLALRRVFDDDEVFLAFLASLFYAPAGEKRFSIDAYYENIWAQCLRHNPEPMLPGQPLPPKNTIAGRYVEMLAAMNRMMRTA